MAHDRQQDDPSGCDMCGIPMLVLLFYIAFVAAPALVALVNTVFAPGWMRQLEARLRQDKTEYQSADR